MDDLSDIAFRIMDEEDLDRVPVGCQGERSEIRTRIESLGARAMLALDGDQHVGQLQFRRYDAGVTSPDGLFDPLYWGDYGEHAPELPDASLALYCYHVGQLDDSDARDVRYQGRGIGAALLDRTIVWAEQRGFEAIVAKASPAVRNVMAFMGGQNIDLYRSRGFDVHASWIDAELRRAVVDRGLIDEDTDLDDASRVSCCVRRLGVS